MTSRRPAENRTWIFSEDAFILLQDILEEGGELTNRVAYEDLVDPRVCEKGAGALIVLKTAAKKSGDAGKSFPEPFGSFLRM